MTFRQIIAQYTPVDCKNKLNDLPKNGRDYSKPSLESQIDRGRQSNGKEKPRQWIVKPKSANSEEEIRLHHNN